MCGVWTFTNTDRPELLDQGEKMIEKSGSVKSSLTSRRNIFGLLAATVPFLAGLGTPSEGSTRNSRTAKLVIRAPKDGFTIALSLKDQDPVATGDIICRIGNEDELRAIDRVTLSGKLIDVEAASLAPEMIDARRSLLKTAIALTEKYIDVAQDRLNAVQVHVTSGTSPGGTLDLTQALAARFKADKENEKAKTALKIFELGTHQSLERLRLLREQVAKEEIFIRNKMAELVIRAPRNGVLQLSVAEGSFLKKGQIIAEIS